MDYNSTLVNLCVYSWFPVHALLEHMFFPEINVRFLVSSCHFKSSCNISLSTISQYISSKFFIYDTHRVETQGNISAAFGESCLTTCPWVQLPPFTCCFLVLAVPLLYKLCWYIQIPKSTSTVEIDAEKISSASAFSILDFSTTRLLHPFTNEPTLHMNLLLWLIYAKKHFCLTVCLTSFSFS